MRLYTMDRMTIPTNDKNEFHAPTELGKTRRITPEGYLLCKEVAIARTGTQTYHVSEIKGKTGDEPLKANGDGQIIVDRVDDEVFSPVTIASFEGKSITVEHPNDFVTPDTYKQHEVGTVHNVHRGEGIESDLLLADLLIKDPGAIAHANRDLPEVSCGYDSEYDQKGLEPGHAIQRNITGNHVALVDRGRAGPRCAIKDHSPKDPVMKSKGKFMDQLSRMFTAFQSKDEKEMEKIAKEVGDDDPEGDMTMDAKQLKEMRDWIESRKVKDEAEENEKKKKKEADEKAAKDALLTAETTAAPDLGKLYTGDALKAIFSRAEILAPGISIPTTDALATKGTLDGLMSKALKTADATETGKECINSFLLGRTLDSLTGDALLGVFNGSAELMRQRNNFAASPAGIRTKDFGKPTTPAAINEANQKFWAGRG